jgi:hypothetical protein
LITKKTFDSEEERREACHEMLKECYNESKRSLKFANPAQLWHTEPAAGSWNLLPVNRSSICGIALEVALTLVLSIACPLDLFSQSHRSDVAAQLPSDYENELAAGAAGRSSLGTAPIALGDSYPAAHEVWSDLLQDSVLQRLNLPFRWQLALVDNNSLNAFSLPDGEVLVDRSLANLLGQSRGLWAALLSHEIAHVARRHWSRRSSFASRLQQHLRDYSNAPHSLDPRWQMAAFDAHMDAPEALAKFSREQELEADTEGMMLMVRTGFHPDFELAIRHLLEASAGETSSFETAFSTYPRWITRERDSRKAYSVALAEFARRWPTAATSPGGAPPTVLFLGKPKSESSQKGPSTVTFTLRCVNPGVRLRAVLKLFAKKGKRGPQREAIEYWEPTTCAEVNEEKVLSISSPGAGQLNREWRGEVMILNAEGVALERSDSFTIRFFKIEKQSSRLDPMAHDNSATVFETPVSR